MKHLIKLAALALVLQIFLGGSFAFSQVTFKIPFKFEADGKSYPPGNYKFAQGEEGKIILQSESGTVDVLIPVIEKISQSSAPIEAPQLIFDMVANFKPSYTEYVTDYLLAEVWLTEKDGFLVLSGERSEYTKVVKAGEVQQ